MTVDAPVRPIWEYRVLAVTSDEAALNALGAEGWELAVCIPYTGGFHLIFKRRVRVVAREEDGTDA